VWKDSVLRVGRLYETGAIILERAMTSSVCSKTRFERADPPSQFGSIYSNARSSYGKFTGVKGTTSGAGSVASVHEYYSYQRETYDLTMKK
jgi:hypothetical protein